MSAYLKVGAARTVITPALGTILFGYAPGRPAESVADDLTVAAIAMESAQGSAILLSITVCSIGPQLSDQLRKAIGEQTGVGADGVILSVTHTHSGPNTAITSGWGKIHTPYIESILIPRVVDTARQAW